MGILGEFGVKIEGFMKDLKKEEEIWIIWEEFGVKWVWKEEASRFGYGGLRERRRGREIKSRVNLGKKKGKILDHGLGSSTMGRGVHHGLRVVPAPSTSWKFFDTFSLQQIHHGLWFWAPLARGVPKNVDSSKIWPWPVLEGMIWLWSQLLQLPYLLFFFLFLQGYEDTKNLGFLPWSSPLRSVAWPLASLVNWIGKDVDGCFLNRLPH